jgi:hypothetical protein
LDSPPDEIKFNDADPSVLFLVSRNQLMRSGDFGKTWKTYSDSDLPGLQPNTGEQGKGIRSFYRNDAHPNQVRVHALFAQSEFVRWIFPVRVSFSFSGVIISFFPAVSSARLLLDTFFLFVVVLFLF